ncbi:hypothetical protein G4D82_10480 [Flavobacterium sp. CYK-4]|uniref:hypothetical protein n=1 Tax=Flavobacterium lotistagni TaxID=2709660 RepID=UPI001409CFA6|nr:hypothetical protein [Flavobacterium lotistagni]NHM07649.1 hypothetical protein [Flavobacterium lotistagni]
MPITDTSNLKQRDLKTFKRIESAQNSAQVLSDFFDKGFQSFEALKAIVKNYFPNTDESRLWDFWHFRNFDSEILAALKDVLKKLN